MSSTILSALSFTSFALSFAFLRHQQLSSQLEKTTQTSAITEISPEQENIIPEEGSVYDYQFDIEKNCWVSWNSLLGNFEIPIGISYNEIIVPTPDTLRYTFLTKQLVKSHKHILTTGPTGTGKTVNIVELITRGLTDKYLPIIINFSAQTSKIFIFFYF
mgnify:CR=1 FL=1